MPVAQAAPAPVAQPVPDPAPEPSPFEKLQAQVAALQAHVKPPAANVVVPIVPPPVNTLPAPANADFVGLFHAATASNVPWPEAVASWAEKLPANAHVLKYLKQFGDNVGSNSATVFRLIDEVLKGTGAK